jgi:nucleoside-diphosphate-sugar epimerase
MQKVLVTGASGFLGRHIVKALSPHYIVRTLSRHPTANYKADLGVQIPAINEQYEMVVHAAGKAHQFSNNGNEAEEFFQVNVNGISRLCQAFEHCNLFPSKFVFISSVSVYGLHEGELINEVQALNGRSLYARSKIEGEIVLTEWCQKHGVKLSILRLPLIAGPHPPGNLGAMINAIKSNRYFTIDDGAARKSIVMADDVANSLTQIAAIGGTYHLTDGYHPGFAELASSISKQLGKNPPLSIPYWLALPLAFAGNYLGTKAVLNSKRLRQITATLTFDDSKARLAFGWSPLPVLDHFTIN